nr:MAG TPA: Peptidase [Caudoviricetes sp.]
MYIIFNKDGSVSESQLTDYINQHSDGVNFIDISIVGKSVDEYTADGNFKLPNKEVVSLVGSFTNKIKTSTGVYEGYRITLSSAVTEYQGDVALSIQVFNSDKTTLFTYPVTLYVNETTGRGGDPITQDQYEALRAMMADYQLQYARSNMRSYDTLAEATEDLPNLSNGQMILAKETADSETSAVFQKVGDKLEGVSLDGLSLDKYLRNDNAVGKGDFTWEVGNFVIGYKPNPIVPFRNIFKVDSANGVTMSQVLIGDSIFKVGIGTYGYFEITKPGGSSTRLKFDKTPEGDILTSGNLGEKNGVASLDSTGKIPTSQLPAYVSDVLEFPTFDKFPTTGEVNKIYIALDTNKTYRWGGTVYVEIGSSLALGETSETAWAGDKGKANQDNIATLKSDKLDKYKGALPPGYAVYGVNSSGGVNTEMMLLGTTIPNTVGQVVMTQTGGEIWGRSNQLDQAPSDNEFITKEYATAMYGNITNGVTNTWASKNVFKEEVTLTKEISEGGEITPAKINFKTSSYNLDTPSYVGGNGLSVEIGVKGNSSQTSFDVYTFYHRGSIKWTDKDSHQRLYNLPSKSGTIALTSDIPTIDTSAYVQIDKDNNFQSGSLSFGLGATLQTEEIKGGTVGNVGSNIIVLVPSGNNNEGAIGFVSKGSAFGMGLTGMVINTTGDFFVGEDFSSLNPAWKAVTGLLSPWQFGDLTKGYEAIGFVNAKDMEGRSQAPSPSRLTFFSPLGKVSWFDIAGRAKYDYQLPKKSGTIALTSDLSEAGTSVTIRRW